MKHSFCVARQVDRVKSIKHLSHHVLAPVVGRVDEHDFDAQGAGALVDKTLFRVAGADKEHHCVLEQRLAGGLALLAAGDCEGVGLGTFGDAEGEARRYDGRGGRCVDMQASKI